MGFGDVFKILILPALTSLALYALLTHLLLPLYRRHRDHYLPLQTITSTSTTLRDRFTDFLTTRILPHRRRDVGDASGDELYFGEEEGESMVGFDFERVDRRVRGGEVSFGGHGQGRREVDSQRRLSREVEEGFKDDSSEEGEGDDRRRS